MVVLYCKIGTGPAIHLRTKGLRTQPKIGDRFLGKESDHLGNVQPGIQWEEFLLREVKGPNPQLPQRVCYLERT